MNSYRLGLLLDVILIVLFCILPASDQAPKPTVWDEIARPYVFSISEWEFGNFFDKWGYSLEDQVEVIIDGQISSILTDAGLAYYRAEEHSLHDAICL